MNSIENIQKKHESELGQLQKEINELEARVKSLENGDLLRDQREQESAKVLWELHYCHQKSCRDHHEKVYK